MSEIEPKKSFIQKREGPHERVELQRKALRRGKSWYSDQPSSRIRTSCVASTLVGTEEEEDQMARS